MEGGVKPTSSMRTGGLLRRMVRACTSLATATLSIIALAALTLCFWSIRHSGMIELSDPARAGWSSFSLSWSGNTLSASDEWVEIAEPPQRPGGGGRGGGALRRRAGWQWELRDGITMNSLALRHALGPLRWDVEQYHTTRGWMRTRYASFPAWLPVIVAGTWPLVSLILILRRRLRSRTRAGCCEECGYDLRATPTSGEVGGKLLATCPECGTPAQ